MSLGTGYAVDIESGRPLSDSNSNTRELDKKKINRIIERRHSFLNDLAGSGGEVVREVVTLYADRINKLIAEDEECIAYQKILSSVGLKINMGKKFSALKAEEAISSDGN